MSPQLISRRPADALAGAADILAEEVSEKAELRQHLRDFLFREGLFVSRVKAEYAEGTTKFEMYRDFRVKVRDIAPHNLLALRRGENEGVLTFTIEFDEEYVRRYIETQELHSLSAEIRKFYRSMLADAFERLMRNTLIGEVRLGRKEQPIGSQ